MATLADELQNDFADLGDEFDQYDEDEEATAADATASALKHFKGGVNDADDEIEMQDGDGAESEEGDVEIDDTEAFHDEAEEETEARIKRQRLEPAVPKDMAAVAKFVTSMKPVLEVSFCHEFGRM